MISRNIQTVPFINIEDVYNFRAISPSDSAIRPDFIFRSAQPYNATGSGIEGMKALGITTTFDLRSDSEVKEPARVTPVRDIDCIKRISIPIFETSVTKVAGKLMACFDKDTETMMKMYTRMLAEGPKCFRKIYLHLRDKPRDNCVIHCALGKDRTGVAIALILSLAGVPKQEIAEEYALTNTGLEPYRPVVRKVLASMSNFAWDEEKVAAMLSVRKDSMLAVLDVLGTQYGGVETYLKHQCLFSDEDIKHIKCNLRTPPEKQVMPASTHEVLTIRLAQSAGLEKAESMLGVLVASYEA